LHAHEKRLLERILKTDEKRLVKKTAHSGASKSVLFTLRYQNEKRPQQ
jgi:hypothetical protein